MTAQLCKQAGGNIQTDRFMRTERITSYYQRSVWISTQSTQEHDLLSHQCSLESSCYFWNWGSRMVKDFKVVWASFSQFSYLSGVFFGLFVFGVGGVENMRKKWLMFYWVCLPFRFVWLHLMFPVAFLFVLIHPPDSITSDLAASQPLWFSKAPEHETETLNMGQIFILWSSLLTSLYLSTPFCFCSFLISW